ncbi:high mobility group B protein 6-like [Ananas comosus]|uniref:High mobility group B protein 6-like n=1 Tax=Ananas comosus TaxID=4615 RepID=A0A6P5F827_ANACO|nr:high mobility group B protein 6-like [Ananas comosus]
MATVAAKKGRGRKALNAIPDSDANISAEKGSGLAAILSPQKSKRVLSKNKAPAPVAAASAPAASSFADELQDLQEKLQKLQIEKEKTEELLRERDAMLREKEEEIENRGKERERLQAELKKLQKTKEFKPTVSFPLVASLREKEEQEGNEKKKKKKKKKKNCAERKKPCPAYILWCRDQWNEIKRENSEADFKEVSNALGAKWKALGAEEKQPYEDKYQQEKEAYLQIVGQEKRENEAMKLLEGEQMQKTAMELLDQYLQFKQEAENEGKKVRKEKDPSKPKQPMSAFFLFSKEQRSALLEENKNVCEIAKIAGEEWKNMTEERRAPYEEIARKEKEEYHRQMEIYKQKKLEEAATLEKEEEEHKKVLKQEALQLLKRKEKTENIIKKTKENHQKKKDHNTDPNKPKKPASSFLLFSKETRKKLIEQRPGISNTTLNALISVKWKELSNEEKQIWNNRAAEGMAIYKKEMEEYNKSISTADNIAVPNKAP